MSSPTASGRRRRRRSIWTIGELPGEIILRQTSDDEARVVKEAFVDARLFTLGGCYPRLVAAACADPPLCPALPLWFDSPEPTLPEARPARTLAMWNTYVSGGCSTIMRSASP
jgi:hypothetical protein